ncbi:hypothetical protein BU14_0242s0014 [Porphyra umbilicalis]|uniref:Maf-like protein n=1 Tax=Porphyra umbilicalis TaxID=2786 RepID=A0A1X6P3D6_PORUM|nr:hypothetical protein BU14_0242s0014 [Porphyra umbilicalis]|eukprot:OSX75296.1 hypothetical protein BU14_0242s0014 [Porphyra umbilicalis]
MLVQHMAALNNGKRIVLASGSPRRREILTMLGLAHEVHASAFEENLDKGAFPTPAEYAKTNASSKAAAVVAELAAGGGAGRCPDLVIGSDTIVVVDGRILEKPRSEAAAYEMLATLSGREHSVLSAVALFTPSRSEVRDKPATVFCEHTRVRFAPLSPETIAAYIRTGEPMDKAGSYGIQGVGGSFITGITGCYYNVMGFPLHAFTSAVARLLDAGEL